MEDALSPNGSRKFVGFWTFLYPDGLVRIDGLYSRVREEILREELHEPHVWATGGNLTATFSVVNEISC